MTSSIKLVYKHFPEVEHASTFMSGDMAWHHHTPHTYLIKEMIYEATFGIILK